MNDLVELNFSHIRSLSRDIKRKVSGGSFEDDRLRVELAGMFAVTIVASYEGIVKAALVDYASKFHSKYRNHVENEFLKMNARISLDDLRHYSRRFGLPEWTGHGVKKNQTLFHKVLSENKIKVERRFRKDMFISYDNLFEWRNAYAHQRSSLATFDDVYDAHRVAQYVVKSFVTAFEKG